MNILFISHYKWPHIGGVEKHIKEISEILVKSGHNVKVVSEEDIKQPRIKFFGLIYIWYWFFKNISLIYKSDIVHVHDVFIWYLPFRFLFPLKKVFVTFHGWEGKYPIPFWNVLNKRIASILTNGSIAVGKYIEKYYDIKSNYIIHGAVNKINTNKYKKAKNTIVWLGRKDKDTGYLEFQKWLTNKKNKFSVKYILNDPNPEKYLKTTEYCAPSGYLSYLEAKNFGCKILLFPNNQLKKDYWNEIKDKGIITWDDAVSVYTKLWQKS